MIVCSCNVFSENNVRACLSPESGAPRTPAQVYRRLKCTPQCGSCASTIRAILQSAFAEAHQACTDSCGAACPLEKANVHDYAGSTQGV